MLFKEIYFLAVVFLLLIIFSEKIGRSFYKKEKWSTALLFFKLNPLSNYDKYNLIANCYAELNNNNKAIQIYKKILKTNQDYQVYQNMGLSYIDSGLYKQAYESFKTAYKLKYNENTDYENAYTTKFKTEHDIEQIEYLIDNKVIEEQFLEILDKYRSLKQKVEKSQDFYYSLNQLEARQIKYDQDIYIYDPDYTKEIINSKLNYSDIENSYLLNNPNLIFFDDFLEDEALEEIKKCCLLSTVWHEYNRKRGYIASYMSNGFNFKIVYKLAEELQRKFPKIFKDYHLRNVWAFKYMDNSEGVLIHADEAMINVNFWIIPDNANIDSNSGGMVVYNQTAPQEWHFNQYNKNTEYINNYLKDFKAESKKITYKQNRVVIFDSGFFHETDKFNFKSGYENHRINVTLLFGKK